MKHFTVLICSPRKPGNGELFFRAVGKELGKDWHLEIIRLIDWDIKPCKACYTCLFEKCPQKDGMDVIIQKLLEADAVGIGVPTYFLGANSLLKRFMDRGLMFYEHLEKLWGKPMVGITTAGVAGLEGYTKLMVDSAMKIMGGNIIGSLVVYGAFPGECIIGDENHEKIKLLAEAIKQNKTITENKDLLCPLCGGDSFRFLGNGKLKCLTCSSNGAYHIKAENIHLQMIKGDHALFLTLEDALKHAQWLRLMKKRFLEVRNTLKPALQDCMISSNITCLEPLRAKETK